MKKALRSLIYFCLLQGCFLQAETLKVLPIMNFRNPEISVDSFVQIMMPLLEKNGIMFVDKDPDFVLICGRADKSLCKKFSPINIVIFDEEERASLDNETRKCLKRSNVKALFKNTVLRSSRLNNGPVVNGSYHFKIINDGIKKLSFNGPILLTDKQLKKIECVLWDIHRSFLKGDLEGLKSEVIDFNKERPVDVSFVGAMWVDRLPGLHRQLALKQLKKIKNYNVIAGEKRLPKDEYLALLKNSKIVVSPWGFGEWCWRDFEAIYSGAVLIKPDTSFVQGVPDLYKNDIYYVPCKADFSDLEEKITDVLNNYSKFTAMRKRARRLLVDNWNYEMHAKNLADALKKIFKKYSQ